MLQSNNRDEDTAALRLATVEATTVNVPYRHPEVSALVARDGVTDIIVRLETVDGLVGWGESCSGADAASVEAAVNAMAPYVVGRDAWNREAMRAELFWHGLWQFRETTGNFAWAGIDMALADLCARAVGQPLYRMFGGLRRTEVSYFCYLSRGSDEHLQRQIAEGLQAGFEVFYIKVGVDHRTDEDMVAAVREALGPKPRLRVDANAAWSGLQARRMLSRLAAYDIDFCEQPVRQSPIEQMRELRQSSPIPLASNEGLWTEDDAYARIRSRAQDVVCFSPYWTGSLAGFHRLSHIAAIEGISVCKHTHGELGLTAAANHHLLLTLPLIVEGHQQTAHMMDADILTERLPIADGPTWGVPQGAGLGVEVDQAALSEAAARYQVEGQYLPWQP